MSMVPDSHPRVQSLRLREKVSQGYRLGLVSENGLIAHGRGEAFYYLLDEQTHAFAEEAIHAASAMLILADHPVFSVNGNVAAIAADRFRALQDLLPGLKFEINLFHYSEQRVATIGQHLVKHEIADFLIAHPETSRSNSQGESSRNILPGLDSHRRWMHPNGIGKADVVFVPLEDGDRAEALVKSGRSVITVDLNPMSRTSHTASVSIVDELTQVLPKLSETIEQDRKESRESLRDRIERFSNIKVLEQAEKQMRLSSPTKNHTSP